MENGDDRVVLIREKRRLRDKIRDMRIFNNPFFEKIKEVLNTIYNDMYLEELAVLFVFCFWLGGSGIVYNLTLGLGFLEFIFIMVILGTMGFCGLTAVSKIFRGKFRESFLITNILDYSSNKTNLIIEYGVSAIVGLFLAINTGYNYDGTVSIIFFVFSYVAMRSLHRKIEVDILVNGVEHVMNHEAVQDLPNNNTRIDKRVLDSYESIKDMDKVISEAVERQLKSEKLKTELITNISHDLKTPLTSIVNYSDLLTKEDLSPEEKHEYIVTLNKNAERMKSLIVDLVDASKTSTGNIDIDIEIIEFNELVLQSYALFNDRFERKNLDFIYESDFEDIILETDGNNLSRVIENLLSNISKYSMENTRVYGTTRVYEEHIVFELKNISKTMLNISSDELMEQFVRGDESRSTEGSGLGLYIARNLMDLLNGDLELEINGDMFISRIILKRPLNYGTIIDEEDVL